MEHPKVASITAAVTLAAVFNLAHPHDLEHRPWSAIS